MKDSLIVVLTFILFLSTINTHLSTGFRFVYAAHVTRGNSGVRTRDTYVTPRPAPDPSPALGTCHSSRLGGRQLTGSESRHGWILIPICSVQ